MSDAPDVNSQRRAGAEPLDEELARLRAENRRLRSQRDQLRDALAAARGFAWRCDADGRVIWLCERAAELLDRPLDEMIGRSAWEVFCGDGGDVDGAALSAALEAAGSRGEPLRSLRTALRAGGRSLVLEISATPQRDASDELEGFAGVALDVTHCDRAESGLLRSEGRLRALYEAVSAGVVVYAPDGRVLRANRLGRELLGPELGEGSGWRGEGWWTDEDGAPAEHPARTTFRTGRSVRQAVLRVVDSRGLGRWVSVHTVGLRDDRTGDVVEVTATLHDIDELKRTQQALARGEAELRSLLRVAPVGIGLLRDRTFLQVNDGLCQITGYERSELLGRNARFLYPSDADYEYVGTEKYAQIARSGSGTVETRWRRRDGEEIDVLLSSTPLDRDDWSKGISFTVIDITSRKRAEQALARSEALFRGYFELGLTGMAIVSPEGRWVHVNDRLCAILGRSRGELRSATWRDVTHPDDLADELRRHERMLAGELDRYSVHKRMLRPDGETVYVTQFVTCTRGPDGGVEHVLVHIEDVTESKRAEEALRRSEERFRNIVNSTPMGVFLLERRADGQVALIEANPAADRHTGVANRDLLGLSIAEAFPEVAGSQLGAAIEQVSRTGEPRRLEGLAYQDRRVNGVFDVTIFATFEGHLAVMFENVTRRVRTERDLERVRSILSAAIEQSPAGILIADAPDVRLRMVNAGAREIILGSRGPAGDDAIDALRRGDWRAFALDGTERAQDDLPLHQAIRTGEPVENEEVVIRRPSGEDRWVLANAAPVRQADGKIAAGIVVVTDITDRKRAEQEARRLRTVLQDIIDSMPSMLVGVDADGRVTRWNRQAERETGIGAAEAIGRPLDAVLPRLAGQMQRVASAVRAGRVEGGQRIAWDAPEGRRHSEVTVFPLTSPSENGAVVRIDDVTDRVRLEEMMIQSEKMVSVGGLAAGMAHEINNPLAGVLQNIQVVANRLSRPLPANHRAAEEAGTSFRAIRDYVLRRGVIDGIDAVRQSGQRAARIVRNMLAFSRTGDSSHVPHELPRVVDKALELAASDYELKRPLDSGEIVIERRYEADLPPVPCNDSEIEQVLLNLLRNAVHALSDAPGDRPGRIVVGVGREGEMGRIDVIDNGPGMSETVRRRAFEPFFTTKEPGVGTGLGLSVSYFIVMRNHGGRLSIDTGEAGTRVSVLLPLEDRP